LNKSEIEAHNINVKKKFFKNSMSHGEMIPANHVSAS